MSVKAKLYGKSDWQRETVVKPSPTLGAEKYRDEARRDFARLIHCPSFRRLQGKTQLFPSHESDFFRNRLTHSLEVAQIAKSIAVRFNSTDPYFSKRPINLDLVEFAGLAHDLGHPPFGHNGEATLDRIMLSKGGFEGNAQTLRLLSRIEKKTTKNFPGASTTPIAVDGAGDDLRLGLNLTYRTLASILKYDKPIPPTKTARETAEEEKKPCKGYYADDAKLVERIKAHVCVGERESFKTVECSIMDVADDIAYSTYDLEDAFKANFLSPISMISKDDAFRSRIASKVEASLRKRFKKAHGPETTFKAEDVSTVLGELFRPLLQLDSNMTAKLEGGMEFSELAFAIAQSTGLGSHALVESGYLRTAFTSDLVGRFIRGVEIEVDEDHPSMSKVSLNLDTFKRVETLKHFAFELLISSPMLKIAEKRGDEIIRKLFDCFNDDPTLMPVDWRDLYKAIDNESWQSRVVCDYIAGMSDRYCVEVYGRLTSETPITIWKPH